MRMQIRLRSRRRAPARPTQCSSVFGATRARARLRSRRCFPPCTASASFCLAPAVFGADQSYYQQIIDRVTSNLAEDAELAGWAMCQGKMGPAVKQRYEAMLEQDPDNVRFKMLLDNWVAAKDHPPRKIWTTWLQPPKGRAGGVALIADGGRSIFLNETSSRASGHEVPCSTVLRKTKATLSGLLCVRNSR